MTGFQRVVRCVNKGAGRWLAMAVASGTALSSCAHPTRLSAFDYRHRPTGYAWVARALPGPGRAQLDQYYGRDPATGWTVYVGPDGVYYSFAHPPPIEPSDLQAFWRAHDAQLPTRTTGSAATRPTPR